MDDRFARMTASLGRPLVEARSQTLNCELNTLVRRQRSPRLNTPMYHLPELQGRLGGNPVQLGREGRRRRAPVKYVPLLIDMSQLNISHRLV